MKKKFKVLFLLLLTLNFISMGSFSYAIQIDDWAKPSYENLSNKHMIPGILKNQKNYKQNITRLEFTHLIVTYLLSNKSYSMNSYTKKFKDTDDVYVNFASQLGIISGYNNNNFKPSFYINRSEAAVIIYNTEKIISYPPSSSITMFKDYKFIPTWATNSVGSLAKSGVISGDLDKNFNPSKNITIQEAFVIINKLASSKKNLMDAFNISKNDGYMNKTEYDFILSNIPTNKYKIDDVKEKIFSTFSSRRNAIYANFLKYVPYTSNQLVSSPDLIFDDGNDTIILGIEKRNFSGKLEQRVFMINLSTENTAIKSNNEREFSPWFTVEK